MCEEGSASLRLLTYFAQGLPFLVWPPSELAKSYCQRAYSLDRTDKQLFMVWPRVEAALGDRLKARLLYERALDLYPLNTKLINVRKLSGAPSGMGIWGVLQEWGGPRTQAVVRKEVTVTA